MRVQTGSPPVAAPELPPATGENFPVALRVLPRDVRRGLTAIYAFARFVDDIGDDVDDIGADPAAAAADRSARLDEVDADLDRLYGDGPAALPAVANLRWAVVRFRLDATPFHQLVAANRQDQRVHRYRRVSDLYAYCDLSANPVGHLVLAVFGADTPARRRLADRICTGLQLVEHTQDVVEDLDRGRVYLPEEDLERFVVSVADLRRSPAPARVRALVRFQTDRADALLAAGAPLVGQLRGWARLAIAGYVGGGRAAVRAVRTAGHDVSAGAPRPARRHLATAMLHALVVGR